MQFVAVVSDVGLSLLWSATRDIVSAPALNSNSPSGDLLVLDFLVVVLPKPKRPTHGPRASVQVAMSAIRRNDRRGQRIAHASPYSRPAAKKSVPCMLGSLKLLFLNLICSHGVSRGS